MRGKSSNPTIFFQIMFWIMINIALTFLGLNFINIGVHLSIHQVDSEYCTYRKLLILYLIDGRPNQIKNPKN